MSAKRKAFNTFLYRSYSSLILNQEVQRERQSPQYGPRSVALRGVLKDLGRIEFLVLLSD